jgi:hypothetical protein
VQCEVARRCLLRGIGLTFRDCGIADSRRTAGGSSLVGGRDFIGAGAVGGCHDSGRMVAITARGGFASIEWDRSVVRQGWGERERQRESVEQIASAALAVLMLLALCSCFLWVLVNNPQLSGADDKPRPRPEMMAPKGLQPHDNEQSRRVALIRSEYSQGGW